MRKNQVRKQKNTYSILTLDDDVIMTETIQAYFEAAGFHVDIENDPYAAIERVKGGNYDILLLDFLMQPIYGDEVVARIREFNKDLFIILLTGHKSMAPPIKTIRELDIQGYYEKSERFDQLELLIESCLKSIDQMRTIRNYRDGLGQILDSVPATYQLQPIEELLQKVIEYATELIGSEAGYIYLKPIFEEDALAGETFFEAQGDAVTGIKTAEEMFFEMQKIAENHWQQEDIETDTYMVLPLLNERSQLFGIVGLVLPEKRDEDKEQLLSLYIKQISSAISNLLLHTLIRYKNEELQSAYNEMEDSYMEMVKAMRLMVDAKDVNTRGHSDRVSYYAGCVAEAMGRDEKYCERIRIAGLFHDIGKLGVSDNVLFKEGSLTSMEYEEIKLHPTRGKEILGAISHFDDIAKMVECHHEWYDGRGYPNGVAGEEIPEEARILSVVDAFDAMVSVRTYTKGATVEEAVSELVRGKGSQFDAAIVDVFVEILKDYESLKEEIAWTFPEQSVIR